MTDSQWRVSHCRRFHVPSVYSGLAVILWVCGLVYSQPILAQSDRDSENPLVVDPDSLDLGRLQPGVRHRRSLRLTNTADVPITVRWMKGSCSTRIFGLFPRIIAPDETAEFEFSINPGLSTRYPCVGGITALVADGDEDYPFLRCVVRGETYTNLVIAPKRLRLADDPTGRIMVSATDGEPFRILAVDPPIAVGLVEEAKLEHDFFLRPEKLEFKKFRSITVYVDKPTTDRVVAFVLNGGTIQRQSPPNMQLFNASNASEVQAALDSGADPNTRDIRGATALFRATRWHRDGRVQLLLDAGVPIDASATSGQTALMRAIQYGNRDDVQLLIAEGASVEPRDIVGATAVIWAARYSDSVILQMLLDAGANLQAVDELGFQAIHWAALGGNLDTARALVEKRVDVNAPSEDRLLTPLMCAALHGRTRIVKVLLDAGADVEAVDNAGRTALMWAMKESHPEAARILQDASQE